MVKVKIDPCPHAVHITTPAVGEFIFERVGNFLKGTQFAACFDHKHLYEQDSDYKLIQHLPTVNKWLVQVKKKTYIVTRESNSFECICPRSRLSNVECEHIKDIKLKLVNANKVLQYSLDNPQETKERLVRFED